MIVIVLGFFYYYYYYHNKIRIKHQYTDCLMIAWPVHSTNNQLNIAWHITIVIPSMMHVYTKTLAFSITQLCSGPVADIRQMHTLMLTWQVQKSCLHRAEIDEALHILHKTDNKTIVPEHITDITTWVYHYVHTMALVTKTAKTCWWHGTYVNTKYKDTSEQSSIDTKRHFS